jgi:transposase
MHHIGIDLHSKFCTIQHIVEDGSLGSSTEIATEKEALFKYFDKFDQDLSVTFEAGRNYWSFYNMLKQHPKIKRIQVVDPRRSRRVSEELSVQAGYGRAKNDRIDAEMLAEQDRQNRAPIIRIPNIIQFEQRTLMRHRMDMVNMHTSILCKIHSILALHGNDIRKKEFLNNKLARENAISSLSVNIQEIVINYYTILTQVTDQAKALEIIIFEQIPDSHPNIRILLTLPGVGPIISRVIHTEVWDIERFKFYTHFNSYSGLAPIDDESAGKRSGRIKLNKFSNRYLKYAFILAAHHARNHPKFRRKYRLDEKKHGAMRAKLNLARRLNKHVFWMLTRQQPFQE